MRVQYIASHWHRAIRAPGASPPSIIWSRRASAAADDRHGLVDGRVRPCRPRSGFVIAGPIASGRGMTEPNLGQIRLVSLRHPLMSLNPHGHDPRNPFVLPKRHGTDYSFYPFQFFK